MGIILDNNKNIINARKELEEARKKFDKLKANHATNDELKVAMDEIEKARRNLSFTLEYEKNAMERKEKEEAKRAKKEKEEQEKRELEQGLFKADFKKIKRIYKNQSLVTRIGNVLQRRKPNWKYIMSHFSAEELDYIIDVFYGDTVWQKEAEHKQENENSDKRMKKLEHLSFKELQELQRKTRLSNMIQFLNDQYRLQRQMKEDKKKEHERIRRQIEAEIKPWVK